MGKGKVGRDERMKEKGGGQRGNVKMGWGLGWRGELRKEEMESPEEKDRTILLLKKKKKHG